jgi:hypothetical protein
LRVVINACNFEFFDSLHVADARHDVPVSGMPGGGYFSGSFLTAAESFDSGNSVFDSDAYFTFQLVVHFFFPGEGMITFGSLKHPAFPMGVELNDGNVGAVCPDDDIFHKSDDGLERAIKAFFFQYSEIMKRTANHFAEV